MDLALNNVDIAMISHKSKQPTNIYIYIERERERARKERERER